MSMAHGKVTFQLCFELDHDVYTCWIAGTDQYGEGETPSLAFDDLRERWNDDYMNEHVMQQLEGEEGESQ